MGVLYFVSQKEMKQWKWHFQGNLATLRLAQLVELLTINQTVAGSIPVTCIIGILYRKRKVRFGIM